MPRNITPQMTAALSSGCVKPTIFVEATFANGPVYLWNGIGSLSWNGQTWLGVGSLGSVSTVEEATNIEAKGLAISLSGINPTLLADALNDYQTGLPVMVWLGLFDASNNLIPSPVLSFSGRMDQPAISMSGDSATITINCESRLLDMNTSVERRYTDQDQQIDYPGDLGFSYVNAIQDVTIYWGAKPSGNNNFTTG